MTIIVTKTGVHGDLRMELERLENLVADLRHLANGYRPSPRNLDTAPMLDNWEQGVRPDPCLIGTMAGHPYCRGRMTTADGFAKTTTNTYTNDTTNWYLGRLTGSSVTSTTP